MRWLPCLVHITLCVLDDAAAVSVAEAEPVLTFQLSLALLPHPNVHVTIRPPLHPVAASQSMLKVAGVQHTVLELLHSVAVESVSRLQLPVRKGAAVQTAEASFVIAATEMERCCLKD